MGAVTAAQASSRNGEPGPADARLAGMSLAELYHFYQRELFDTFLPFWDKHGIDHQLGGFLCHMDYDGTLADTEKFVWFQGRGIWVYSFLYNYFGQDSRHLGIARKTKDFLLAHAPLENGWWATSLSTTGQVLQASHPDVYALFFGAEGLQEYAYATGDESALKTALSLLRKIFRHAEMRDFQLDPGSPAGIRQQGVEMMGLRVATQILRRWNDPETSALAERCVEAIIHKYYNPDIGLNNEVLKFDFSRTQEGANQCLIGDSVEALWMVMGEADRRGDRKLWDTAADRVQRHLEVGWDWVFGGLSEWVNVDAGCYEWPPNHPTATDLEFRAKGEYLYLKSFWALNEGLVATLKVYDRRRDPWAAAFYGRIQRVIEEKYSQRQRGLPGYMLFGDRRMTPQAHVRRQDNYHPPRQMMLNLLTLSRMLRLDPAKRQNPGAAGKTSTSA
jgi:N-acylglucosamine 2-epimerase